MTLEELGKKFQEKLGTTPEAFNAKVNTYRAIYKRAKPSATPEQIDKLVERALKSEFKAELRSPAKHFVGMILGMSTPFDTVASMRQTALDLFKTNPEKAIREGFVDEAGNPLDNREMLGTIKNPRYGKQLPDHDYIRNIFGVAHETGKEPKPFRMVIRGDLVTQNIPMFAPVSFRANISTKSTEQIYLLNQSTTTRFEYATEEVPGPIEIFESKMLEQFRVPLANLEDFLSTHTNRDIFITKGDVVQLDREPNTMTGNRRMLLDDIDRPEDKEMVTAWIPDFIQPNFGKGSQVYVVGTGNITTYGEPPTERAMINVWGLYASLSVDLEPAVTGIVEAR